MKWLVVVAASLVATAGTASAQAVKSTILASNGVEVTVYADEFANRYEYTSPWVKMDDGQVAAATVKKAGVAAPVELTGFFVYSGEWRRYSSALFQGGDPANFTSTSRDVGRCYSSRYSRPSCSLSEGFKINLAPTDLKAHSVDGTMAIQVRAQDTSAVIFRVPAAYVEAVAEVSRRARPDEGVAQDETGARKTGPIVVPAPR